MDNKHADALIDAINKNTDILRMINKSLWVDVHDLCLTKDYISFTEVLFNKKE